jgi:hypothetical protein
MFPMNLEERFVRHTAGRKGRYLSLLHMPTEKDKREQRILWNEALKQIGSRLEREWQPEQDVLDRFRKLIAQLDAILASKRKIRKWSAVGSVIVPSCV